MNLLILSILLIIITPVLAYYATVFGVIIADWLELTLDELDELEDADVQERD